MIRSLTKMVHWISDDSFDQWSHLMVIVSTGVIWWSLCPMESSDGHCVQWSHLIVIVSNGVIWWSLCPMESSDSHCVQWSHLMVIVSNDERPWPEVGRTWKWAALVRLFLRPFSVHMSHIVYLWCIFVWLFLWTEKTALHFVVFIYYYQLCFVLLHLYSYFWAFIFWVVFLVHLF